MGNCIANCTDPPFVCISYGKKKKIIRKSQFLKCKRMEDIIRQTNFFPIVRIVSMKTNDRGIFPWDSPTIYPELEVCIEDQYKIKKYHTLNMVPLYR